MELQHTFTVPAPIERAWSALLDVEGIAPCFPGASLTRVEGDEFSGTVKVKLGPVSLQYAGKGRFVERDEAARRVVLEAHGTDKRGNGTAAATVQARLEPDGVDATHVVVDTDLKVTGRPAQFGRGMLQDVGGKIVDQFAGCLAARMSTPDGAGASTAEEVGGTSDAATPPVPPVHPVPPVPPVPSVPPVRAVPSMPAPEAPAELDLGSVLLPSLVRRYAPGLLAGLVAVLVVRLLRRRTR